MLSDDKIQGNVYYNIFVAYPRDAPKGIYFSTLASKSPGVISLPSLTGITDEE